MAFSLAILIIKVMPAASPTAAPQGKALAAPRAKQPLLRGVVAAAKAWWQSLRRTKDRDLTPKELSEALALRNTKLVKELYETAQRQLKAESERQTRLDSKATGLLTVVGLSLTVVFTFGGQFVWGQAPHLRGYPHGWPVILTALGIAIAAGLFAGAFAMLALRVRGSYMTMSNATIFNEPALADADTTKEEDAGTNRTNEEEKRLARYQRYLLIDMWTIAQNHYRTHERKAHLIRIGQGFYALFLAAMITIGTTLLALLLKGAGGS